MRLAEMMSLGRLVLTPTGGLLISGEYDRGCALGMAGLAGGCFTPDSLQLARLELPTPRHSPYMVSVMNAFPILSTPVLLPNCGCSLNCRAPLVNIIVHLFDEHVTATYGYACRDWTLDRLIEYVQGVEDLYPELELHHLPVPSREPSRQISTAVAASVAVEVTSSQ
jgi:hypothetical protein